MVKNHSVNAICYKPRGNFTIVLPLYFTLLTLA